MAREIHKNQPSVILQHQWVDSFGTIISIAAATVLTMKFQRPGGSIFVKDCIMPSGGVDGIQQYTSIVTDFDVAGNWKRQFYNDVTGWGDIFQFTVKDNL